MKKLRFQIAAGMLSLFCLLGMMSGCSGKKQDELPAVVTQGIPEDEKVKSTIVSGGFTIDIHITYAEIVAYSGSETALTLPETAAGVKVKLLGESVFKNNTKLTKVTLPSGLIMIDRYAFEGCTALKEVVFNDGLETIGDYAFRNSGITVLNLPDSVSGIGKYSFYNTKIESLKIPANVSRAGKYAFYGCSELKTVEFCPRMYEIAERMFYNCTSITEIVIPKTVTKIDDYAFSSCTSLTKIVIPSETETIGEGVFVDCPSLTIYAPSGSAAEKNASRNKYSFEACDYDSMAGTAEGEK